MRANPNHTISLDLPPVVHEYAQELDFLSVRLLSLSLHSDTTAEGNSGEVKKQRLDSAEFQRILNAKSSHDWVVKEVSMPLS